MSASRSSIEGAIAPAGEESRGPSSADACSALLMAALHAERREIAARHALHGFALDLETYRAANLRDHALLVDLGAASEEQNASWRTLPGFFAKASELWRHRGLLVECAPGRELRAVADGARVTCLRHNPMALPLMSECVDGIFLRDARGEAAAMPALLAEIRRVVRPAGRAVFVTPSRVDLRHTREFCRRLALELPELGATKSVAPALTAESASAILGPVFGPLEMRVFSDALHFQRYENYARFFETFRGEYRTWPNNELWQVARDKVRGWANAYFETRRALAEPLSCTIFVATVL